ncbi:hypothetical protein ALI22I_05600 [Saccharothrix sp. ALI-22-I]|nr:hypothetical protein ALI22I_05600 [Saccharothrix sp. ALI-22-I]
MLLGGTVKTTATADGGFRLQPCLPLTRRRGQWEGDLQHPGAGVGQRFGEHAGDRVGGVGGGARRPGPTPSGPDARLLQHLHERAGPQG